MSKKPKKSTIVKKPKKSTIVKKTLATGALFATIISLASILYKKHVIKTEAKALKELMQKGLNTELFVTKECVHGKEKIKLGNKEFNCVFGAGASGLVLDVGNEKVAKIFLGEKKKRDSNFATEWFNIKEIQKLGDLKEFVPQVDVDGKYTRGEAEIIIYDSGKMETIKFPYILMEHIPGTLLDVFSTQIIDKKNMMMIILMILLLIEEFCAKNIKLTDIKLANIFWRKTNEKIEFGFIDFGIVSYSKDPNCIDFAMQGIGTMLSDMKTLTLEDPEKRQKSLLNDTQVNQLRKNQDVFITEFKQVCNIYKSHLSASLLPKKK